jgi:hypothetical protein
MTSEKITIDGLVDLCFERTTEFNLVLKLDFTEIHYHIPSSTLWVGNIEANAETIEDVKELIRLFK